MSTILIIVCFVLVSGLGGILVYFIAWDIRIQASILRELETGNQLLAVPPQYLPYHRREIIALSDTQELPQLPIGTRRRAQLAELRRTELVRVP